MKPVKQVARILGRQAAPPVRLRQGIITAINGDGTVDLTLGGYELTGVPALAGSSPSVSDPVMVNVCGRDMFVLGKIATSSGEL